MIRKEQVEEPAQNQMFSDYLHNLFLGAEKIKTFSKEPTQPEFWFAACEMWTLKRKKKTSLEAQQVGN